jgi:hypothetical protein
MISTKEKKESSENRFAKVQELKKFHQATFDALGKPDAEFIPKMAYVPKGMQGLHLGFFASELSRGVDFFTEFVNKDLSPEDPERKLYLWKYNAYWQEEYQEAQSGSYTFIMIPVSELYVVDIPDKKVGMKAPTNDFVISDLNDAPISDLTIRDLAAILLKKPISNKEFLNEIISK